MAATSPIAVASSASAMPGATTARLVVFAWLMPMNEFMMPQTVPNRPTKGAVEPIVASRPVPRAIARPARASMRDSAMATRSLMPSSPRSAERRVSSIAAPRRVATGPRRRPFRPAPPSAASERLPAPSSRRSARRAAALAEASSSALASQIVQVTTEAKANPTITAFTTMSAAMNMPQGERSCGTASGATGAGAGAAGTSVAGRGWTTGAAGCAALGGAMPKAGGAGGSAVVGAAAGAGAPGAVWAASGRAPQTVATRTSTVSCTSARRPARAWRGDWEDDTAFSLE